MNPIDKLLGGSSDSEESSEEPQFIGLTAQELEGRRVKSGKDYFASNEEEILGELRNVNYDVEAYLNGEEIADTREEAIDVFENYFTGISPKEDYLIAEETEDGIRVEVGRMEEIDVKKTKKVKDPESNRHERTGYENVTTESWIESYDRMPESSGRVSRVEYGEPDFVLEVKNND